jgi:predicted nucleotidyltransferase
MGGSGGGGRYRLTETEIEQLREEARDRLRRSRLDAEVNSLLQQELVQINDRDPDLVGNRLDEVEEALRENIEEFDRVLFGGSVAKHTYVDGLSDIDSLVVLDADVVGDRTPEQMREEFREILNRKLNMGAIDEIRVGQLAVTIRYLDGMEVQLLPSVQRGDSQMIPSPDGRDWSPINPKEFSSRLTLVNQRQGDTVVPAIKIAKAVIANMIPNAERPNGYHVEAMAVAAFEDYGGSRTPKAMVEHFFASASGNVMTPIRDVTGQSSYLDSSLGPAGSQTRQTLARRFDRIAKTMRQAQSVADWRRLLRE